MTALVPRWYQRDAATSVMRELETHSSTLVVLPTSTGKTVVFSQLAASLPGRVLIIAHRTELLLQALKKLVAETGEDIGFEQGPIRSYGERIVVASAQTIWKGERLQRMVDAHFDYIIVDEVHHYMAKSFKNLLESFWGQLIGFTATPNRHDKKALKHLFKSVAYQMDLLQAQDLGLVVPLEPERIIVKDIDISEVEVVAGDLSKTQLDKAMVRACAGIADQIRQRYAERRGFIFMPGKASAELLAQLLNGMMPGSAICVTESTPKKERARLRGMMDRLECRFVCNAMLFTEGVDWPAADFIAPCRYTKSTPLLLQMLGRGGRPLDGVLDGLTEENQTAERLAAIAASPKPHCKIADFVGNFGRHRPVTIEDALGESLPQPVKARAALALAKIPNATSTQISSAFKAAAIEVSQIQEAAKRVKVNGSTADVHKINWRDPMAVLKLKPNPFGDKTPATMGQRQALERMGFDSGNLTKAEAGRAFQLLSKRRQNGECSIPQLKQLSRYIPEAEVRRAKFDRAHAALNYVSQKGWHQSAVDTSELRRILFHGGKTSSPQDDHSRGVSPQGRLRAIG